MTNNEALLISLRAAYRRLAGRREVRELRDRRDAMGGSYASRDGRASRHMARHQGDEGQLGSAKRAESRHRRAESRDQRARRRDP
jgi:hypothetical protein